MFTETIIGDDGEARKVPLRIALELNDEADQRAEMEAAWRKRIEERRENPYLERLDSLHTYGQLMYKDMRDILQNKNLTQKEVARIFEIAEIVENTLQEIRQLSFEHELREDY